MGVSETFNNGKVTGAGLLIKAVKDGSEKRYVEIYCDKFIGNKASGNSYVFVGDIE